MSNPKFRQLRRTTYALKRALGQPISLCRTTGNVTDFATGRQYETLVTVSVARVVVLPAKDARRFMHAQTDVSSANQKFAYGAMFDARTRAFLLDRRDVPSDFPVDLNMHLIFKAARWEVKGIEEFEDDEALIIVAQEVDGALVDVSVTPPTLPVPAVPPVQGVPLIAKTSDYVLTTSDLFKIFTNTGATGPVSLTVPTLAATQSVSFRVDEAFKLSIIPPSGATITNGGDTTGVGSLGSLFSDVAGSFITIYAQTPTKLIVLSSDGAWDVT